jgi:hypothetical protein
MKIGYAAALSLVIATPALSAATKTVSGVTFECKVTGSDKDGYDLTTTYNGDKEVKCTASCQFTMSDGKKTAENPKRGSAYTTTVRKGIHSFYGEAGLPGKPLTNPNVTASCE